MFRLTNSEVRELTPQLAAEFRDLEPSPTEREIDPTRIKHLYEKAEAGHLVTFHWSVAQLGNRKLRMNGQHSANMLCGLNGAFPEGLTVHLDEYQVDTPDRASPVVPAVRRPQEQPVVARCFGRLSGPLRNIAGNALQNCKEGH